MCHMPQGTKGTSAQTLLTRQYLYETTTTTFEGQEAAQSAGGQANVANILGGTE